MYTNAFVGMEDKAVIHPESKSRISSLLQSHITQNIAQAMIEDIGARDLTVLLIPESQQISAKLITRENMVLAGRPWAEQVFAQLAPGANQQWQYTDGDQVEADECLVTLTGCARGLLTAERIAMNFLQTLSGTATTTAALAKLIEGTQTKLLDTRKTIPGLRFAQKYAVQIGGGMNHRMGLFDAFLVKENHIAAAGGIAQAVAAARQIDPQALVEIEVETFAELEEATLAGADRIMLDNFSLEQMREAVSWVAGRCKLEASGNIDETTLLETAQTGVDYISSGALTKHVRAIDLSMRVVASHD